MGGRRIAVVLIAVGVAVSAAPTRAQPEGEIDMGGGSGSGSDSGSDANNNAGTGSADAGSGSDTPAPPPEVVKDPKLAKKFLATGKQLINRGDYYTRYKKLDDAKVQYENAVTAYRKAIELGDDLNVWFDLANAYDKLGQLDEAARIWRTLTKATGLKPDIVKKSTSKLEDALTKLGTVTFKVQPEGATITLANSELGKAPLPEAVILMPGTYTFSFTLVGYQPKELELTVEAGSESERGIELEPEKVVVAPIKPRIIEEPPRPPSPKPPDKLVLYIGAGATGAMFATSVVTGLLAVGKHGTFTAPDSSAGERADAQSSGKSLARISDITLVGTLAAGGFTAYWYLYKYKPAQRKFATEQAGVRGPNLTVVPWVQPESGGVTFAGRF